MKLIVGIGNPDPEYQQTRHNIGFSFLDYLANKFYTGGFLLDEKLNALTGLAKVKTSPKDKKNIDIVLAKPLSYVNKSGEVVSKLAKFYKIKAKDIIIVHDDLDIEFGSFKNSFDKNSGGHKGIDSIIKALKTKEFYRLRIGVAVKALQKARQESDAKRDAFVHDFVLAKFSPANQDTIKKMFPEIYNRLLMLLKQK